MDSLVICTYCTFCRHTFCFVSHVGSMPYEFSIDSPVDVCKVFYLDGCLIGIVASAVIIDKYMDCFVSDWSIGHFALSEIL